MLNQVPRTLLNIGIDSAVENKMNAGAAGSPPFDWDSLTLAAEGDTKTGEGGGQDHHPVTVSNGYGPGATPTKAMVTPRTGRANGGGGGFFGAGENNGGKVPPPLSATRGRGRPGGRGQGGNGDGPPLRSTFTNESIADQALKDFGDGAVSAYHREIRR